MPFADTTIVRRFAADRMQKLNVFETPQMFCDIYCLEPGQSQKPHTHSDATKFYYVVEGQATLCVGEQRATLGPGGLGWAAAGELHGVENLSTERVVLLVAMAPNPNVRTGQETTHR